jgi:hypothetical protein
MAKSSSQLIEEGRAAIAGAMTKVGRLMNSALEDVTDEEVKADIRLTQKDAPMYLHIMKAAYVAQVRIDATAAPTVSQSLNVTIVQRADSNGAWLKMAEPHRQIAVRGEKPPALAIDVPVVVEAKKK